MHYIKRCASRDFLLITLQTLNSLLSVTIFNMFTNDHKLSMWLQSRTQLFLRDFKSATRTLR